MKVALSTVAARDVHLKEIQFVGIILLMSGSVIVYFLIHLKGTWVVGQVRRFCSLIEGSGGGTRAVGERSGGTGVCQA